MAPSIRVGCSLLRDRMRPSVRPLLTRAWIVQGVGQRKAWSLEHVHRHASRRAVAAHEAEGLVRLAADNPGHSGRFTVPARARLVVSGRQESLRCRPTRQFSRLVLRPSSVDFPVRSRPHSMRLHPTTWRAFGSASHTNKPWFIQAMEAARTPTAEGSNRCDVRLF